MHQLFTSQYGCRPKNSSSYVVHELVDEVITLFDNIWEYIWTSFDKIDNKILSKQLEWHIVLGIDLKWFRSYLITRQLCVHYEDTRSSTHTIQYSIPQGSLLSPLLFIICTNDLPNYLMHSKDICR